MSHDTRGRDMGRDMLEGSPTSFVSEGTIKHAPFSSHEKELLN